MKGKHHSTPRTTQNNIQITQKQSQPDKSAIEVIDLDTNYPDPTNKDILASQSSLKQSWVWNHFKESSDSLV